MIPLIALWSLMAVAVLVLAVMRKMASRGESEVLHPDDKAFEDQQMGIAQRLEKIDHWGKIVTAVTFVYGLCLLGVHLYNVWMQGQTIR
jgi:hypothetical protein